MNLVSCFLLQLNVYDYMYKQTTWTNICKKWWGGDDQWPCRCVKLFPICLPFRNLKTSHQIPLQAVQRDLKQREIVSRSVLYMYLLHYWNKINCLDSLHRYLSIYSKRFWNYCLIYRECCCLMIFQCFFFFFCLNCALSLSCVSLFSFSFQLESYHSGTSKFFARRFTIHTIATLDIFYFLVHEILSV